MFSSTALPSSVAFCIPVWHSLVISTLALSLVLLYNSLTSCIDDSPHLLYNNSFINKDLCITVIDIHNCVLNDTAT